MFLTLLVCNDRQITRRLVSFLPLSCSPCQPWTEREHGLDQPDLRAFIAPSSAYIGISYTELSPHILPHATCNLQTCLAYGAVHFKPGADELEARALTKSCTEYGVLRSEEFFPLQYTVTRNSQGMSNIVCQASTRTTRHFGILAPSHIRICMYIYEVRSSISVWNIIQ